MTMDNECCAKCRYYHRLKNNFKVGVGFEESHCCDLLLHLPDDTEGWVQEVTPQDMCGMYEEKDHIADIDKMVESTPNDCETCIHNKGVLECDMYGCEYEPTTKNCRSCRNFGSHHGICEICKDNKCWTEEEPTKNNLVVDCIVDILGSYTDLDIPYKREIAENILTKLSSVTPQSCDAISRQEAIDTIRQLYLDLASQKAVIDILKVLPSVTPQEPRWIPVNEKLPKPFMYVNATCRSLIDDRENWVVETLYLPIPKEGNKHGYSDWGNIPMLNCGEAEVIAWVERIIPQPYKSESEDSE